jgi:ferredoxin
VTPVRRKETTVHVDRIACNGQGVCAELLPEWIVLDDWGYPIVRGDALPADLEPHARWAVANCPTLALKLRKVRAGGSPP